MATLVIKSAEFGNRVIELNLGVNRFGRSPENAVQIEHPTVSATHCEIVLADDGVVVRDCDSANGTYVDAQLVKEARLFAGQTLRLGEIELLVETTDVTIAIPQFDMPRPAPPVVLSDGSLICPRHPKARATHQCTHCREVLCDACVHHLRRRGGKLMKLCPLCSHPCLPLGAEKRKKKSFFGLWRKTTKLPFFKKPKQL
ncbi:MAG TPA: FHA domain-containing protein [Verrucomicrobiae bacterium]